jgi:hypothetical protein
MKQVQVLSDRARAGLRRADAVDAHERRRLRPAAIPAYSPLAPQMIRHERSEFRPYPLRVRIYTYIFEPVEDPRQKSHAARNPPQMQSHCATITEGRKQP